MKPFSITHYFILSILPLVICACVGTASSNRNSIVENTNTISETDIPEGTYVSRDYRFVLLPREGWTILEGEKARLVDISAQVAAVFYGLPLKKASVAVEHLPGLSIEQLAEHGLCLRNRLASDR